MQYLTSLKILLMQNVCDILFAQKFNVANFENRKLWPLTVFESQRLRKVNEMVEYGFSIMGFLRSCAIGYH